MLAIIPARAGSKGVPGKNKRLFCGKPLIEWTIDAGLNARCIDKILVSTDDSDILNNKTVKNNVHYLVSRPKALSNDSSPAEEYIWHALHSLNEEELPEYFCVLQPTSPLRLREDIDGLYEAVLTKKSNSGVTVVEVPHNFSPESLMLVEAGVVKPSLASLRSKNLRQTKARYFARNGAAVYICRTDYFLSKGTLFDYEMAYWEMSSLVSVDIDTEEDFIIAELIMKDRLC